MGRSLKATPRDIEQIAVRIAALETELRAERLAMREALRSLKPVCEATTRAGRPCPQLAIADGLCFHHTYGRSRFA